MSNKLVAAAATDAAAEKGGAWFEYSPDGTGTFRVKLRRAGTSNPDYMRKHSELMRPWRNAARPGQTPNIPPEKDREIMRKLFASTIVVDWNADDFGEPYSQEAVENVFAQVNDFLDWVIATANSAENYRKVEIEGAAGN